MPELTAEIIKKLKNLIASTETQDELECRKYLMYAEEFLFKHDTLKKRLYSERETPTNMGITDYVISGIIGNHPSLDPACVRTYIWEFKAPQCYLFKKDNENRLSPTKELFKAENQLFNYYHSIKLNITLLQRFKTYPNCVFVGGIIIGSNQRLLRGNIETEKKKALLKDAFDIRRLYVYKETGLLLATWSDVLDRLTDKYVNLTKDNVVPGHIFKDSRLIPGTISSEQIIKSISQD